MKSVRIRSLSDLYFPVFGQNTPYLTPYSVRMPENTDQKNSGYGTSHTGFMLSNIYITGQQEKCDIIKEFRITPFDEIDEMS